MKTMRQSWMVGTPRCGVRAARRADPTFRYRRPSRSHSKMELHSCAFTLIEVMVATTIFFMAMFAILGVLSAGVHAAVVLRTSGGPAAGMGGQYFVVSN